MSMRIEIVTGRFEKDKDGKDSFTPCPADKAKATIVAFTAYHPTQVTKETGLPQEFGISASFTEVFTDPAQIPRQMTGWAEDSLLGAGIDVRDEKVQKKLRKKFNA